jgi:hypothetical protein
MRRFVAPIACVLVLGAAGCGGSGDKASDGGKKAGGTASASPATDWPKADGGVIGEKMCGLLRQDDFSKYGRIAGEVRTDKPNTIDNGIVCDYALNETLTLDVQKSQAAAKARFNARRLNAKDKGATITPDVVTEADESWRGPDPDGGMDVHLRRGALLVSIHLDDKLPTSGDPAEAAVGLAKLVLQRAPELGAGVA